MIQFDSYFSNGLKPPTSFFVVGWKHKVPPKHSTGWSRRKGGDCIREYMLNQIPERFRL